MVVEFWTFSKRHNSTKRPTAQSHSVGFVYKDTTDLHNPLLEVKVDVQAYNYAKIGNTYFYVESINTVTRNVWQVQLKIDLLATYKSNIQNGAAMVLYSASLRNENIVDDRIIPLPTYTTNQTSFYPDNISIGGTYFVRVMGKKIDVDDGYNCGLTPVYMMDRTALKSFIDGVTVDNVWDSVKDYFTNAMDGFIECYWLPFDVLGNYATGEVSDVKVGGASIPCGAYVVTNVLSNFTPVSEEVEIPWVYDDFRNNEPYTALYFFTPWTGVIKLNASDFYGLNKMTVSYALDIFNGDLTFNVKAGTRIIATISGNAKINLPLSQATINVSGMIAGGVATAGGVGYAGAAALFMKTPKMAIASGVATAVAGLFGGISSAAQNQVVSKGNMSGTVNAVTFMGNTPCALYVVAQDVIVDPINNASIIGYPLGAVAPLAQFDGFVQTSGASISAPAYESEVMAINKLLDGGVYIE